MTPSEGSDSLFRLEYSEVVEAEIEKAYQWLLSLPPGGAVSFAVAERWLASLETALAKEIELLSGPVRIRRQRAEDSTPEHERFRLLFRVGSGSSAWNIIYELVDDDEDGVIDTLRVLHVRHAARG